MTITPDHARELLDGATSGSWSHDGRVKFRNWRVNYVGPISSMCNCDGLDVSEEDADLAAAAPDLAQTIAGMTEEWGVERDHPWSAYVDGKVARGITWIGDEARARKACATPPRGGNPRLVRRLVGPVEVVE